MTASPAASFVSHDRPLRGRITRIPNLGLEAMILKGVLRRICGEVGLSLVSVW